MTPCAANGKRISQHAVQASPERDDRPRPPPLRRSDDRPRSDDANPSPRLSHGLAYPFWDLSPSLPIAPEPSTQETTIVSVGSKDCPRIRPCVWGACGEWARRYLMGCVGEGHSPGVLGEMTMPSSGRWTSEEGLEGASARLLLVHRSSPLFLERCGPDRKAGPRGGGGTQAKARAGERGLSPKKVLKARLGGGGRE